MKYKLSKQRITLLIVLFPLAVLIVYGLMSYLLFSNIRQKDILQEVKSYGQSIYVNEKERLKEKIQILSDSITAYDQLKREKINQNLVMTIDTTAEFVNHLYRFRRGKTSSSAIQKEILAALKDVKLPSPYTPIFVMNTNGYVYMHYDRTLRHKVITHVKDQYGVAFVQDFNRMIRYEGKGFVAYSWYKPEGKRERMYEYLAYLKKIDFKNWYIGAGISLEDIQHEIEKDILAYVKSHATFAHGFFFIVDPYENILFAPENKLSKRLMKAGKDGFFSDDKNLYYGKYIKEYSWYLVAARELENIGKSLEQKQMELLHSRENALKKKLMYLGIGLLFSILFSLYLSYVIYRQIRNYEERINESNDKMMFRTRQALIGELFSMIAHQWRQPINKIASIVVLMRSDLQNDKCSVEVLDKSCEEIEESIEYMSETIEDFRTFYKPATTQKRVNLKTLINKSVSFLSTPVKKYNITVIQNLADDIEITLYRNEFLQVMLNIIKNAIDATGENGTITIRLHRHGKKIIISVENTGEPIKERVMRKIFQPYFTTKKESMGLGLYMTKIIVEKHMKGEILIERLEHGTKFIIIL